MDSLEVYVGSSFGDGWESYPTRLGDNVPLGCDVEHVRARIEKERGRLFSALESFELWLVPEKEDSTDRNQSEIRYPSIGKVIP
jgi:hypothetical protein